MTEEELAAFHEAAHAVVAVCGKWTKLAGPVILHGRGGGDVVMSTDGTAAARALRADPGFSRDVPRLQLIRALLAGPVAERILRDRGRADLSEAELTRASELDYANVFEQIGQLASSAPDLLDRLEAEVRQRLEQPAVWSAVERFAAIVLDRGRLEVDEASAILNRMRLEFGIEPFPDDEASPPSLVSLLLVVAAVLLAAFWLARA